MRDLIVELFGEYQPLLNNDGEIIEGIAGIDYTYILGVLLFALMIYCVMKMIGGLISNDNIF